MSALLTGRPAAVVGMASCPNNPTQKIVVQKWSVSQNINKIASNESTALNAAKGNICSQTRQASFESMLHFRVSVWLSKNFR